MPLPVLSWLWSTLSCFEVMFRIQPEITVSKYVHVRVPRSSTFKNGGMILPP